MKLRLPAHSLSHGKSPKGFTMIEVLVSAGIIGVGLLALSAMQITATRGNASGHRISSATQIAVSKVEELKSYQYYQDITNAANIYAPEVIVPTTGELNEGERTENVNDTGAICDPGGNTPCPYILHWTIQNVEDQRSRAAAKRIEVWVTWVDSENNGMISEVRLPETLLPIKFY